MERQELKLKDVVAHIECGGEITIISGLTPICKDVAYNILSKEEYSQIIEKKMGCIMAVDKEKYKLFVDDSAGNENETSVAI